MIIINFIRFLEIIKQRIAIIKIVIKAIQKLKSRKLKKFKMLIF